MIPPAHSTGFGAAVGGEGRLPESQSHLLACYLEQII